jgi:hypothetical protein
MAAGARVAFDPSLVVRTAYVAAVNRPRERAHQRTQTDLVRAGGEFLHIGNVADHTGTYTRNGGAGDGVLRETGRAPST